MLSKHLTCTFPYILVCLLSLTSSISGTPTQYESNTLSYIPNNQFLKRSSMVEGNGQLMTSNQQNLNGHLSDQASKESSNSNNSINNVSSIDIDKENVNGKLDSHNNGNSGKFDLSSNNTHQSGVFVNYNDSKNLEYSSNIYKDKEFKNQQQTISNNSNKNTHSTVQDISSLSQSNTKGDNVSKPPNNTQAPKPPLPPSNSKPPTVPLPSKTNNSASSSPTSTGTHSSLKSVSVSSTEILEV